MCPTAGAPMGAPVFVFFTPSLNVSLCEKLDGETNGGRKARPSAIGSEHKVASSGGAWLVVSLCGKFYGETNKKGPTRWCFIPPGDVEH